LSTVFHSQLLAQVTKDRGLALSEIADAPNDIPEPRRPRSEQNVVISLPV